MRKTFILTALIISISTLIIINRPPIPHNQLWGAQTNNPKNNTRTIHCLKFMDDEKVWVERTVKQEKEMLTTIGAPCDYIINKDQLSIFEYHRINEETKKEEWVEPKEWQVYNWALEDGVLSLTAVDSGETMDYTVQEALSPEFQ